MSGSTSGLTSGSTSECRIWESTSSSPGATFSDDVRAIFGEANILDEVSTTVCLMSR